MIKKIFSLIVLTILFFSCKTKMEQDFNNSFISQSHQEAVIQYLTDSLGSEHHYRIVRGVSQVANLWCENDGSIQEFKDFCLTNFITDSLALNTLFNKLERSFEVFNGYFHKIDVALKEPLHLSGPEIDNIDLIFGSYNSSAHLDDDMYANKIAFITSLNFPFYSLDEKNELGKNWTRQQWAYSRMGDKFIARIPADVQQNVSKILTEADTYISEYNIFMNCLIDNENNKLFPADMKLISHWGLRDELKSNYTIDNGLVKQKMIYDVMKRIIDQSIPMQVINNDKFDWNPITNKLSEKGNDVMVKFENDRRYEVLLNNFKAMRLIDKYNLLLPTYISRAFETSMEISQKDVKTLFINLLSSKQIKEVAKIIESKLGRKLEPFDIWYNGFKSRSSISEDFLTSIISKKYPNVASLQKDLPHILIQLGWEKEQAHNIANLVSVDASRGAGHAWGAEMRNDIAHLRTRFSHNGMDYKGYNIAIHEFGHNVEQTITMNNVDYYSLNGVPNTAFTEAVAFLFQKRDMELLNINSKDTKKEYMLSLDNFWGCYEIMGVALVDMYVWEWLYENQNATPSQLKEAVISIAKDVWNKYYAGILGDKNETILAIYSHMIDNPLYLSNYPIGHIIDFQIELQVKGKSFAKEIDRMYSNGRLTPQIWMTKAVGEPISILPLLKAVDEAIMNFN